MSELKGCGSHSCAVTPPKGVGTNGPCRCMVSDYRGQSLVRSLQAKVERYRDVNQRRKETNAQMLMNAALSGNRNYLAEIESLQAEVDRQTDVIKSDQKMRQENFTLWETNAALQAEVNRLTKLLRDMSMAAIEYAKQLEKKVESLQAEVKRYQDALTKASPLHFNRNTKYGRGWHDALWYINQFVKPTENRDIPEPLRSGMDGQGHAVKPTEKNE